MPYLKLAKATEQEINAVHGIFQELDNLSGYYDPRDYVLENLEDFPVLYELVGGSNMEFIQNICQHVSDIRWQVVMLNLHTLMENCADPCLDTLDFKPSIKKGLQLFNEQQNPQTHDY